MGETKTILALNAFDAAAAGQLDPRRAGLVARRRRNFGAASVLFYDEPIEMVTAEGAWMTDADGRRYLDMYNNVPSVGHCHPRVVAAIAAQAARLAIHTRYLNETVEAYAERLLATFPDALSNLVMTCTGSESNDLALRLAMAATGGLGIVVTETAYHGNTALTTEISPSSYREGRPPARVRTVPMPAALPGDAPGALAARFAADVEAVLASLAADGIPPAALIVDSIFSSDGIFADPPGFLAPAVEAARAAGAVFIADEVQPGFGRTGAGLWGFARHDVVPDIVTMGKPMGNGYPMGGVVTRPDLLERFCRAVGYFNTFGGNEVAAAAGSAVLDVIKDEDLIGNAARVGADLRGALAGLARRHPAIGQVRGVGLFIGLDLVEPESRIPDAAAAGAVIDGLRREGVLVGAAGSLGHTLKIRPPLCLSSADAGHFAGALDVVLARFSPQRQAPRAIPGGSVLRR